MFHVTKGQLVLTFQESPACIWAEAYELNMNGDEGQRLIVSHLLLRVIY